jgi:PTH1 family peptidyl-tRNA hydrolase
MITVIGLGNPGKEYATNRHNTGRIILELLAKKNNFSDWYADKKTRALWSTGKIEKEKMQFVLPDNFMNNSGGSVKPLIKTKKDLAKLVVVYDDLDLPIGRMKISFNRSSGGHNGVESIIKSVKSQEFVRVRIGLSPETPGGKLKKPSGEKAVLDFLLKDFKEAEFAELKKITKKVGEALECFASDGKDKMMSLYNQ